MFCPNCGKNITNDSKFCEYCGKKIGVIPESFTPSKSQEIFYSKDWNKTGLHLASIPYYDILITKEYLYLIELRTSKAGGLAVMGLVGAAIGQAIEKKEREQFRSTYIDSNGSLTSNAYEGVYYLKIPIVNLKNNIIFEGKKIIVSYEGKTISLGGKKEEVARLHEFVNHLNQ